MIRVLGAIALGLLAGCSGMRVGGTSEVAPAGFSQSGDAGNVLAVGADGQTTQRYISEPPAAVIVSGQGIEHYGAVPPNALGISLPDGTVLTTATPGDFEAERITITKPDGNVVDIAGVSVNTSDVIVARATFLTQVAPIVATWTQAQKDVLLKQFETQAALGDSFAKEVLPFIRALVAGG